MGNWSVLAVAAVGGVAVALQGYFVGVLDARIGTAESVLITYGLGGVVIGVTLAFMRGGNLAAWRSVPWWAFLAGLLGLVIIASISYSVHRVGLVAAFTTLTVVQFVVSGLIDHFGWLGGTVRPLDATRLLGITLLLLGGWLTVR